MITIKDNKIIIEESPEEIKRLIDDGVIYEIKKNVFKFLDKEENIFVELKGGLK
jgi:hypothetical protein